MMKLRMKISGGFRSELATLRSVLARKQGRNRVEALLQGPEVLASSCRPESRVRPGLPLARPTHAPLI